jgi:hypothetical protein
MAALAELGLDTAGEALMLVGAPDDVVAEAGSLKPRPSLASTIQVAEPTPRLAWWPERRLLAPGSLSHLRWMLQAARGRAWLVFDPADEEALTVAEVRAALHEAALHVTDERQLTSGDVALAVTA